ncbi:MAG: hypothetical protein PF690_03230 [Deltaproteobacteria bacterium]|jgi:trimethylamine:corrinoid methyltransferase-like protein|nr:hypothetical protein [Deltaproteobacteria bacterium]
MKSIMTLMGMRGGQYRPLLTEQIRTLHKASLKIIEKMGMMYEQGNQRKIQYIADDLIQIHGR